MKTSLNQLKAQLKDIAQAHLQINSFHFGDLEEALNKSAIIYPLMNCYAATGGDFKTNTTDTLIVIEIYDKLYKDSSNLDDVISDTKQECRDVFQIMNRSARWRKLGRVSNSTTAKFKWGTQDEVAGHIMTVTFTLRDVSGICDLPLFDYDYEGGTPSAGCPDAGYPSNAVIQTGQVINYGAGDQPSRGRDVSFFVLDYVNEWGHSFRFVGQTGGYTDGVTYFNVSGVATTKILAFPNNIIFDFSSRKGTTILSYYIGDSTTFRGYTTALPLHVSSTFGGLTGWHLWNDIEMRNIMNISSYDVSNHWVAHPPFEWTVSQRAFITSTRSGTSVCCSDMQSMAYVALTSLTNALLNVFVRYTTLAELGL